MAICPFIPAFRHSATFSENASAVMAMMGIPAAHGFSSTRMFRVASRPFISGIWISIQIRSYCPSSAAAIFSTQIRPFSARSDVMPYMPSMAEMISQLMSLSSAIRICMPARSEWSSSASRAFASVPSSSLIFSYSRERNSGLPMNPFTPASFAVSSMSDQS